MMRACISAAMIKTAYVFAALLLLGAVAARAQELRREPLAYVPADSVVFLDRDKTNFALAALVVDTTLRPEAYRAYPEKEVRRERARRVAARDFYGISARFAHLTSLLPWTADAHMVDTLEYDLYNMVLPLLGYPNFERHPAARLLRSVSGMVYMTDGEGVYVNLYTNAFARIKTAALDLTVDQITAMPFAPEVKLRVGRIAQQTPLTFRVRIPAWQRGVPTVYVNGHEMPQRMENGYFVIRRTWNSGDEIYFDLDLTPRRLPHPRLLQRGPLLYVADRPAEGAVAESGEDNREGHLQLCGEGWTAQPAMDVTPERR